MRRDNRFFVIKIAAVVVAVIAALIMAAILFRKNNVSPENENEYMAAKVSSSPKPTAIVIDKAADTDVLNDDDYDDEQAVNIEVTDSVSPEFFMMDAGGEVVVYYSDKRTVFMHTGIPADMLGADERERLKVGYYIDNEEELYALLESYSS